VEGSCEHGNEPSGSIKCWEFLEWLHNWQLFRKGSAPWVSEWERSFVLFYEVLQVLCPSWYTQDTTEIPLHPPITVKTCINLYIYIGVSMSWDSPVGFEDTDLRVCIWFPAGPRDFFLRSVHTGSGAYPASYPIGTEDSFPGRKRTGREAVYSHLVSRSRMVELYLHSPYVFMAVCLTIQAREHLYLYFMSGFRHFRLCCIYASLMWATKCI
jgi:hypothetical protein